MVIFIQKWGAIDSQKILTSAGFVLERRDLAHRDLRKISHKMSKFQPNRSWLKIRPKLPNWPKSGLFGRKLAEIVIFPKFGPRFLSTFKIRFG